MDAKKRWFKGRKEIHIVDCPVGRRRDFLNSSDLIFNICMSLELHAKQKKCPKEYSIL
jgi:hypothetical protein